MMRITDHPILGELPQADTVTIYFENRPIAAREGEMIAAALTNAGIRAFRRTHKEHQPRGMFCGIGRCTDCVMIVDGQPNVRTCVTPVRDGMRIQRQVGLGRWEDEL